MSNWDPQVKELFLKALKLPHPEERAAFLAQACAGQAELRAQVDSLLEAHQQAGSFLEDPATATMPPAALSGRSPSPGISPLVPAGPSLWMGWGIRQGMGRDMGQVAEQVMAG